jgi:hypothetical protein
VRLLSFSSPLRIENKLTLSTITVRESLPSSSQSLVSGLSTISPTRLSSSAKTSEFASLAGSRQTINSPLLEKPLPGPTSRSLSETGRPIVVSCLLRPTDRWHTDFSILISLQAMAIYAGILGPLYAFSLFLPSVRIFSSVRLDVLLISRSFTDRLSIWIQRHHLQSPYRSRLRLRLYLDCQCWILRR